MNILLLLVGLFSYINLINYKPDLINYKLNITYYQPIYLYNNSTILQDNRLIFGGTLTYKNEIRKNTFFLINLKNLIKFSLVYIYVYYFVLIYISKKRLNNIDNLIINIEYNTNLESCIICFEDFSLVKEICKLKICEHIYHKECIKEWITVYNKTTCPLCRKNF